MVEIDNGTALVIRSVPFNRYTKKNDPASKLPHSQGRREGLQVCQCHLLNELQIQAQKNLPLRLSGSPISNRHLRFDKNIEDRVPSLDHVAYA